MKFLLWALVLYLVWRWYQSTQNKIKSDASSQPDDVSQTNNQAASQAAPALAAEKMVGCEHCGIHVPLSEAVQAQDSLFFCSIEHQRQHTA